MQFRAALIVAGLAVVEAVLLGGHVLHGGLYTDDWFYAAYQHTHGTWKLFTDLASQNHDRPIGDLFQALTSAVSGSNPHVHALWGLLTLLAATSSVFLLLRMLSLPLYAALAIVLLATLFPFADSAWLWYAACHSYLAIALAALGAALALVGLTRPRTEAIACHVGAVLLFVISVLTYQTAAIVICLAVFLYLPRTDRRRALLLGALDVVVVVLALTLPRLITGSAGSSADPVIPFSQQIHHAGIMVQQGVKLLANVLEPFGSPNRAIVSGLALLIVVWGAVLAWRSQTEPLVRTRQRRWLTLLLAGVLVVLAAYAIYVPAPIALYQPFSAGSTNRVNVMASFGYAAIVFAVAMILTTNVTDLIRRPLRLAPVIGLGVVLLVLVGYTHRTRIDIASWNLAGVVQRQQLGTLAKLPRPAPQTTVYTFYGQGETSPNVFVFRVTWDLRSAVKLLWDDPTLRAYPIFAGTIMECHSDQVFPYGPGNGDGQAEATSYGHAMFYDFRVNRELKIDNRAQCLRAISTFLPGPVIP